MNVRVVIPAASACSVHKVRTVASAFAWGDQRGLEMIPRRPVGSVSSRLRKLPAFGRIPPGFQNHLCKPSFTILFVWGEQVAKAQKGTFAGKSLSTYVPQRVTMRNMRTFASDEEPVEFKTLGTSAPKEEEVRKLVTIQARHRLFHKCFAKQVPRAVHEEGVDGSFQTLETASAAPSGLQKSIQSQSAFTGIGYMVRPN
eukprot:1194823-Prorocentrum_minimum.AAC.2